MLHINWGYAMGPLCIYHGGCDDGFAAAWAVRAIDAEGSVEFFAGSHNHAPPEITGRHVILVDFSYSRNALLQMSEKACSVVVLDHHKTAADELAGFPEPPEFFGDKGRAVRNWIEHAPRIATLFDMKRSGAGMAWDFFHRGRSRPDFINYIEDRDLWRNTLPGVEEFTIALRSYPQDFLVWDRLVDQGAPVLISEGTSILRYYRLRVREFLQCAYVAKLGGCLCWISNTPHFAASDVAGELSKREFQFGATYTESGNGRWQYSLRSNGQFDVSELARQFGGGGHKGAAGFTAPQLVHMPTQ
jgi:uncharacterized protein